MKHVAILLLGGHSSRMRGLVDDKVLSPIANKPVFIHSMNTFADSGVVGGFVLAFRDTTQRELIEDIIKDHYSGSLPVHFIQGGAERRDSVFNALSSLNTQTKTVYIHDTARPLITQQNLKALEKAVAENKAAVLAHPATDTMMRIPKSVQITDEPIAHNLKPLKRKRTWVMETPQVFDFPLIKNAYEQAFAKGLKITDDVSAASLVGHPVAIVENRQPNTKLTRPEDFGYVEYLLESKQLTKK